MWQHGGEIGPGSCGDAIDALGAGHVFCNFSRCNFAAVADKPRRCGQPATSGFGASAWSTLPDQAHG